MASTQYTTTQSAGAIFARHAAFYLQTAAEETQAAAGEHGLISILEGYAEAFSSPITAVRT